MDANDANLIIVRSTNSYIRAYTEQTFYGFGYIVVYTCRLHNYQGS